MSLRRNCIFASCLFILASLVPSWAESSAGQQWVGTWATSPMLAEGGFRVRAFSGTTLREIAHISIGGKAIRVRFTNEFGIDPLTIANAHVALVESGSSTTAGTDHAITFGGASTVRVPAGAVLYSDPVTMIVAPQSDLAVSFYLPSQVMRAETFHDFADQDNYEASGDVADDTSLKEPATLTSWYFFDGIDVAAEKGGRAIVTFGDSITDGWPSTHNANRRWPDVLAARLLQDPSLGQVGVLNEGIGGNRVLNDGYGPSALARFDRDVLAQDGVRYVIVMESINDIGRLAHLESPDDDVTAKDLELGLSQIANAAHQHGVKAIGATLTPYKGAGYFSDKGEQVRKDVNNWIRNSGTFDGVIDFDKMTADPSNPEQFSPMSDSGDHLHPGDAGYRTMSDGIDLKLFAR